MASLSPWCRTGLGTGTTYLCVWRVRTLLWWPSRCSEDSLPPLFILLSIMMEPFAHNQRFSCLRWAWG
jgi:hypothetical protein